MLMHITANCNESHIKLLGGGGGNAILGHVHLENPKMALENMALNSLKWPLNQKY